MDNKEFNWDEAISLAHKTAVEHGFWDDTPNYEHLAMLVITELSEAIDADRHDRHADTDEYEAGCAFVNKYIIAPDDRIKGCKTAYEDYVKDTVEGELADACIRIMDMMGYYKISFILRDNRFTSDLDNTFTSDLDKPLCEFCFRVTEALMAPHGEIYACQKALNMLLGYAEHIGIDIKWHIHEKMAYNEQRPRLNGKYY